MKELTVLVVADNESESAEVIRSLTREDRIRIHGPVGGVQALRYCSVQPPGAALIHARLQDFTGTELCQLLRGRERTEHPPILVFDTLDDRRMHGEVGCADDYVSSTDLFDIVDRIRRVVRRNTDESAVTLLETYEGKHLIANFLRINVLVDGRQVDLTRRELAFLRYLVSYRNHVLTRSDILQNVWTAVNARSRTIDTHVRRLRLKLGACGRQIQTVPRIGYRFNED